MGKKAKSGTVMNIPDHTSDSLETIFRVTNTEILLYGSGIRIFFKTLDPEFGMRTYQLELQTRTRTKLFALYPF
jgi:hypothetical protein